MADLRSEITELDPVNEVPIHPRPGIDPSIRRWGRFDPAAREYVIERPDTPQPWYNYITNGDFTGYVSQTGGGTCFYKDPMEKRILRVHLHSRPTDLPGRWVYLRDRDSGKFHSITWGPVYTPLRRFKYECRMGLGYVTIRSECDGIAGEITYFVPPEAAAEVWLVKITNTGKATRHLDAFPYMEFLYWSLARDNNLDAAFKCTDVIVGGHDTGLQAAGTLASGLSQGKSRSTRRPVSCPPTIIIHRSYYDWGDDRGGWQRQFGYFAASELAESLDTNIEAFVGIHDGYDRPQAVVAGACTNFVNRGGEPVGAMQIPVTLRAGQCKELAFAVGYAADEPAARRDGKRIASVAFATRQLARVKKYWADYVGQFQAATPDPTLDVPFNALTAYQSAITFICSRSIAPYLLVGTRGLGYRDSNQDTLGAMPYQPYENTKRLITTLLAVQHPAGDACHDFFPGTGKGLGGGYSDDHLWAALSTESYVKESGDLAFLNRIVGFHASDERAPVLEHLERALVFSEGHVGAHGLPLLGTADWNDCLNAYHGAESVFTAGLYCAACKAVESIHRALGNAGEADRCAARHAAMAERINAHAWDGQWYLRLITQDGRPVGSAKNELGRIWIESNTWAVIGQAAPPDRARTALDSVREHLCTLYGHRICAPPYDRGYDPTVGTVTIFSPGYKENGAIFCHTNPWLVVAEAMLGRGQRAFDAFARISPYTKDRIQHIHCAEPYAANSMIIMPPNLEAGRARNPWLTGFVSWLQACMARAILGVRPDFGGLEIDPCVPGWKSFRVRRTFRGTVYDIRVSNPRGVEKGVRRMVVAGQPVAGNVIPAVASKKPVRVEVEMG